MVLYTWLCTCLHMFTFDLIQQHARHHHRQPSSSSTIIIINNGYLHIPPTTFSRAWCTPRPYCHTRLQFLYGYFIQYIHHNDINNKDNPYLPQRQSHSQYRHSRNLPKNIPQHNTTPIPKMINTQHNCSFKNHHPLLKARSFTALLPYWYLW